MSNTPKTSNLETFKLLIFDLYLHCQKNGGQINGTELKERFHLYKIDNHYTKLALLKLNMLEQVQGGKGSGRAHIYTWSSGVPTEETIKDFFSEVYLIRHVSQESLREKRKKERRSLKAIKVAEKRVDEAKESFEQAAKEHIERQVPPTLDSWCLKFPEEKQYFSAFGLEVMRKIGKMFCIESTKELDGQ